MPVMTPIRSLQRQRQKVKSAFNTSYSPGKASLLARFFCAPNPRFQNRMSLPVREIRPELLETYPDDHPDAIEGRKELLMVNAIMGNHRWIIRTLRREVQRGWKVTELGAGDGKLSLRLAEAGIFNHSELHAMDLASKPTTWPSTSVWVQGDITTSPLPDTEVLIANLFLHHFTDAQLLAVSKRISPATRLIIAAEPARHRIHLLNGRLFCALARMKHITRHDMPISIRAGFKGTELAETLALGTDWETSASDRPMGAYRFIARKIKPVRI